MQRTILAAAAAAVLAGCATTLPPLPDAPQAPESFRHAAQGAVARPAAVDGGRWWQAFHDPELERLVELAGQRNTGVQEAAARLEQARALVRSARADRLPQVGVGAAATRQAGANTPAGGTPSTVLQASASVSYEVDLFGRLARAQEAAQLDAQAREALLASARLLVQAEVAQSYLALRALDAERELVRETVAAYADTLRLTERRHRAGDVAELDVVRVQSELAANEAEALALDRLRSSLELALAVLVGESPSGFSLAPREWTTPLPAVPPGVPATVLARRPDVAAAQASLLAAQARVGIAQAAWLPDVALTAAGGFASPELADLLRWPARAWSVGALLSMPLFDGGRREAGVQAAQAQLEATGAQYRGQVLQALREVEDQLSSLRLLAQQAQAQQRAVESARRAGAISETRYRNGLVSQLELLDARRSELRNRRQALQVRSAQYQATVGLIRALGGGWDVPSAAPQVRADAGAVGATD